MLEEAIGYSQLGLSVIPLVQGHKFPPKGITWKDRQITKATENEIRKWWDDHPTCNIGVVTGKISGLDVLDFDSNEDLERFEATICEIPETIKQNTGRGMHACFEYHGGGKGIVTDAGYGGMVDVRTDGGIFVVAPSIHKSGKPYQWLNINPLEMGLDDLLPMPKEILEFLIECKAKQKDPPGKLNPEDILTGDGIPDGLRNRDLYRYACRLRAKGMSIGEALVLVEIAAANCDPPCKDPKKEAQEKVAAAWQHEKSFFIGKAFVPSELAEHINRNQDILHDGSGFFRYAESGVYQPVHENIIAKEMKSELGPQAKQARIKDTLKLLEIETFNDSSPDHHLINLKNGMLDLERGLLPHDKKYLSKAQIPIDFIPDADCPRWRLFLKEIFSDDLLKAKAIQEFAGYCLLTKIFIQLCLFLIGGGGNGKSVLINILCKIVGWENVCSIDLNRLGDRFAAGRLKDKLLNVCSEISSKSPVADEVFKKAVTGDLIETDVKHKDAVTFRPYAKHIFSMNQIPIITDRSFAMARRLLVIRFNRTFTGDAADKRLEDKLTEELPGVLNWCLVGLSRVLDTETITESNSMAADKSELLRSINPALQFVEEHCMVGQELTIPKDTLYKRYVDFCDDSGIRHLSNTKFYQQILADFPTVRLTRPGGGPRTFEGICAT